MKLSEIIATVQGKLISKKTNLDIDVTRIGATDLMSDVLAFADPGSVLLTGLCNPQVVRTADMADLVAIIFVRGKYPPPETIELAEDRGIPLIAAPYTMFETSGRLYQAGLRPCDITARVK